VDEADLRQALADLEGMIFTTKGAGYSGEDAVKPLLAAVR
jgi:hypothetical protein